MARLSDLKFVLAANETRTIPIGGGATGLMVSECTGNFRVQLDSDGSSFTGKEGLKFTGLEKFNSITVTDLSGAPNTVEAYSINGAEGDVEDTALKVGGNLDVVMTDVDFGGGSQSDPLEIVIAGQYAPVDVKEVIADTAVDKNDVVVNSGVATLLLAANADRVEAIITNPESVGGTSINIGTSSVAAGRKLFVLAPGEKAFLPGTFALYAFHTKGSSISVPAGETERP